MATAKTNIDVQNGKLKMTVLDETVEFSVYNSLALPSDSSGCFQVDEMDSLVSTAFVNQETEDKLELILTEADMDEDEETAQLKEMLDCAKHVEE
ncbi:hypothetical protein, partial [Escherichia coli]|uniref:hypothetical protein n=1 Tax=Escherichia coli TaxID=562 RepID=UPI001939B249